MASATRQGKKSGYEPGCPARQVRTGAVVRFSEEVIDALHSKLSTDDSFRALSVASPRDALQLAGHVTPATDTEIPGLEPVFFCLTSTLVSKDEFAATREALCQRIEILNPFAYFQA